MIGVFDSGVCLSALHFGGTPLDALKVASRCMDIAYCAEIVVEIKTKLVEKFRWEPVNAEEAVHDLFASAILIEVTGVVQGVCRDPKDDMILECALSAHADVIITGDKNLLVLGQFAGIRIVNARTFLDTRA